MVPIPIHLIYQIDKDIFETPVMVDPLDLGIQNGVSNDRFVVCLLSFWLYFRAPP